MRKESPDQVFPHILIDNCIRNPFLAFPSLLGCVCFIHLSFWIEKLYVPCGLLKTEHHSSEYTSSLYKKQSVLLSPAFFLLKHSAIYASW